MEQGVAIELAAAFRPYARPEALSKLRIRIEGEKVVEIRWDREGGLRVVHYDRGDCERTIRAWPRAYSIRMALGATEL
jgi:hypothetical protein